MVINIRQAGWSDTPWLVHLARRGFPLKRSVGDVMDDVVEKLKRQEAGRALMVIAEVKARPSGYGAAFYTHPGEAAHIEFAVSSLCQRKRIGQALVSDLCTRATAAGVRQIRARVSPENRAALNLLSRCGFLSAQSPLVDSAGVLLVRDAMSATGR